MFIGVGWSTVVVCFYWAVVVLGYVAPVIHYILLWINPILVKVSFRGLHIVREHSHAHRRIPDPVSKGPGLTR